MLSKIRALKEKKGFTLVELIVVLVILAILAALLIPALTGYISKANKQKVEAECRMAVMAVQTESTTIYGEKGKVTAPDNFTEKVTVDGKEITVAVNVSKATDNALQVKEDGLYVPKTEVVDISGKADKVANATEGNFAGLDANGNLTDSGKKASDFVSAEAGKRLMTDAEGEKLGGIAEGATKVEASVTNGNINVNGEEKTVYTLPETVLHESEISDYTAEEIAALLADDEG